MIIAIAALFATPSFAEPTELDKKTVASKAYVDTKQDKITTGLVEFDDLGTTAAVPALVLTNAAGTALNGNTIGFLDLNTYNLLQSGLDELPDTMVPSIGLLRILSEDIWNHMPSQWTALSWVVNNDNGANRTNAINAYNTTFGNGTNQWAGGNSHLITGQFLANSLALKQNRIPAGNVLFYDSENNSNDVYIPGLVVYDPTTQALNGNKIGILDQETIADDEGGLIMYNDDNYENGEMDNFVPTVRAVADALQSIWDNMPNSWQALSWVVNNDNGVNRTNAIKAYNTTFGNGINQWAGDSDHLINGYFLAKSLALKQNKLVAKTSNARAQAITRTTADGSTSSAYITAGGSVGLTTRSGAPAVINYVNGTVATTEDMTTFTTGTFGASSAANQNYIKGALVSLELLKDVYSELNSKITNNALPTGTTGTVVTYNGVNAETGVQEFTETAISGTATYDDNDQLTNGNNIANVSLVETEIATRQKKRTCAGYEPGHENEADYCWLWNFPDD